MTLQTKLVLLIFSLFLFVMLIQGTLFNSILVNSLEEQIGKRALNVAEAVATMPAIRQAFRSPHPEAIIQPLAEEVRHKTGAQFIVVGNKESVRYSHPVPDRIGQQMVGGDNNLALEEGISYISKAEGTLGPSLRGKAPILDEQGEIIGLVSVGFLIAEVDYIVDRYEYQLLILIILFLGVAILGAYQIAKGVKKAIFGLEPKEIGRLFEERSAILESIHEGIIAINDLGYISTINRTAYDILEINPEKNILHTHILDVLPNTKMLEVLEEGKSQFNQEFMIGKNDVIASRVPIIAHGKVMGVVSSFRKKTDIDQLSKELSQVQHYAESLRSQTHEYSNKLYTISGLIQLGSNQEALELINKENTYYQDLVQFLITAVPDTLIAAILLGKYNRAHELKIDFIINPESTLKDIPTSFQREKLVTILGNLLDNAFEAILESQRPLKQVHLFMTDLGNDLIFEIEDSGMGIPEEIMSHIFHKGFSTKQGEGRGYGLHLVQQALQYLGGYLTVSKSELGGITFIVVIPKRGG